MCNTRPTRQHAHTQENEVLTSRIGRLQGVAPSNARIAPPPDKPPLLNPAAASGEGHQTTVEKRPQGDKKRTQREGKSTETKVAPKRTKSDPLRTWAHTHMRALQPPDLDEWAGCSCKEGHSELRQCAKACVAIGISFERAILAAAASGGNNELAVDLAMEEGNEVFEARLVTEWTKRVGEAATARMTSGHDVKKQEQAEAALFNGVRVPASL